jgi:hypothetical protein
MMKKKSLIAIASIFLNLALFSALVYYNKINSHAANAPMPFIRLQHLPNTGYLQSDRHEIALASTMK